MTSCIRDDAKIMYTLIITCCSISIFVSLLFLALFIKNLYCTYYTWVGRQLSKKIRILTISMPLIHSMAMTLVLIYTIIAKCDNDWGRTNIDHHTEVNNHTILKDRLEFSFLILVGINWSLYSYFILETVHTYFSNNPSMNATLQSSCCCEDVYCWMVILIIMEPVILGAMALLSALMYDLDSYFDTIHNQIQQLFAAVSVVYVIMDIVIHVTLATVLSRGFHAAVMGYSHRKDVKYSEINSRMQQHVVEMTRYLVLFGVYLVIYIILHLGILANGLYHTLHESPIDTDIWVDNGLILPYISFKEISSIICAYLSFEWSHRLYERICCVCDKRCKRRLHQFAYEQEEKAIERHLSQRLMNNQEKYGPEIQHADGVLRVDGVHVAVNTIKSNMMKNDEETKMVNDASYIVL